MKFETKAIHIGEEPNFSEGGSGDVVSPIHLSSTFARKKVLEPTGGYEYSRTGNPTRLALEKKIASLEGGRYGLAFASGMAAATTLVASLLKSGDHVVAFDDLYGGIRRMFEKVFTPQFSIEVTYVDASRSDAVFQAVRENTRLIWLESPTNPTLKLCDIREISDFAHQHGIQVVVDNTFMSPYFQNPLKLGADVVLHSTTKYINGHSDSVGGVIITNSAEIYEKTQFNQNSLGAILSPFDSYLVMRGLKTLAVRMRAHQENAMTIARFLEQHPKVEKVIYPGLPSHPQYELAQKQMSGYGGMISVHLKGDLNSTLRFLEHIHLFSLAESLGGVESLIEHPATMTHASVPPEVREANGISDSLIRLSVGIEHIDDLLNDLENAFKVL
jgi:cystathionine gamma-lyase